jgi:hypothetical protein
METIQDAIAFLNEFLPKYGWKIIAQESDFIEAQKGGSPYKFSAWIYDPDQETKTADEKNFRLEGTDIEINMDTLPRYCNYKGPVVSWKGGEYWILEEDDVAQFSQDLIMSK